MVLKSRKEILVILLILFTLLMNFQNCERNMAISLESAKPTDHINDSDDPTDPTDPTDPNDPMNPNPPIIPIDELIKKCETAVQMGALTKTVVNMNFPELPNISPDPSAIQFCKAPTLVGSAREQRYISYSEQNRNFVLPDNAIICKMDFIFQDQPLTYDDHFLFSFDNKILASNSSGLMSYLENQTPLILPDGSANHPIENKSFDWSLINGKDWRDNGNDPSNFYCLGKDIAGTTCEWPITEKPGIIKLEYPQVVLMQIANQNQSSTHNFSFAITGDNNPDSDCQHTPIDFSVEVSYVIP